MSNDQKAKNDAAAQALQAEMFLILLSSFSNVQQRVAQYVQDELAAGAQLPVTDVKRFVHAGQASGGLWCQQRLQDVWDELTTAVAESRELAQAGLLNSDQPVQ